MIFISYSYTEDILILISVLIPNKNENWDTLFLNYLVKISNPGGGMQNIKPWYLFKMVAQNWLRTYQVEWFIYGKNRIWHLS